MYGKINIFLFLQQCGTNYFIYGHQNNNKCATRERIHFKDYTLTVTMIFFLLNSFHAKAIQDKTNIVRVLINFTS